MPNNSLVESPCVAVVVPCYKVREQIVDVITTIGAEVQHIILVDDGCPEESGKFASSQIDDPRLTFISHPENQGVGAAVVTGIKAMTLVVNNFKGLFRHNKIYSEEWDSSCICNTKS